MADKHSMLYPQKTLLSSPNSLSRMWKMRKVIEYIDTTPMAFMVHENQLRTSLQLSIKRNMMDALASDFERAANSKLRFTNCIQDINTRILALKNRVKTKSFIESFVRAWEIVTRNSQERLQNDYNLHLSNKVICDAKNMFITCLSPHQSYCKDRNYSEAINLYGLQDNFYNTDYINFGYRLIVNKCSSEEAKILTDEFKDILLAIGFEFLVIAYLADKQNLKLPWIQFYRITCWFVPINFYRYQNGRMLKTSYTDKHDLESFKKFIAKDIHKYEKHPMSRFRD
ncbi:hypothetical protein ACOI22_02750 [Glaciecola sp. 2405UD65-10]|uniref:hypothetical protein n=1 Tax=Glaciecola sp. 2405UD65-10 TaxID=3397244 RepID=UPI003B5BA112